MVCAGLGGALALLKERGELQEKVVWGGRTNDMKKSKLVGLEDVYTGGAQEDEMARRIEIALTRTDEFGRVMTVKEAFRDQCHKCVGR